MINVDDKKHALVLFSGGLDSTTVLSYALSKKYEIIALTINYKQRHCYEIEASKKIVKKYRNINHIIFDIDLSKIGGSALTDNSIDVPNKNTTGIPVTYVPARNTIFLSIAASFAEKYMIRDIFVGVNAIDYSGYPDCRPEFIKSYEEMINIGTKAGSEGLPFKIHAPLINLSKSEIITLGTTLRVDYRDTVSCYSLNEKGEACGECDSCSFRRQGFADAGIDDPTVYEKK